MSLLLVAPIIVPFVFAAAALLTHRRTGLTRGLALAGALSLLAIGLLLLRETLTQGIMVLQVGDWPAPFGIVLVADTFAALMVAVTGVVGAAAVFSLLLTATRRSEQLGLYPLTLVLLGGVCGAFLTGDLFNLYVWFEVILIASFVLLALGGSRPKLEGAMKYVILNLLASAFFISAVGILYGLTGTVNMAQLSERVALLPPATASLVAMLFLLAFGIKSGVFPLYYWLPASYPTLKPAVGGLFAGLLTKVGVYALVRVFTLIFVGDAGFTHTLLLAIAGLTMITGVLGALAQNEIRRILSFHIVSQIGFMVMGLALYTPLAVAGCVFYIVHHILVKTNLFLVGGVIERLRGTTQLSQLGALWEKRPWLGILFLIPALSLTGIPPLSGFWAKLILLQAALDARSWLIVAAALVTSLFTMLSMMKIWNEAFWKAPPVEPAPPEPAALRDARWLILPVASLAALTLIIGLTAAPLLDISVTAAQQMLDPSFYVDAVLGGGQA